jgi:tetratricopeptide (TPR) repeat protein
LKRPLLIPLLILAACADLGTPPPAAAPQGESRFLIDPRIGFTVAAPAVDKRFETAWRAFLSGDLANAGRRFADLHEKNPNYFPAALGEAAVAIGEGRLDDARAIVERIRERSDHYTAADVYAAEIALAEQQTRRAYDLYRDIAGRPDAPPIVRERLTDIETRLFEDLMQLARADSSGGSIDVLREALLLRPGAPEARILLTQRLIAQKEFEEARRIIDPVLNTGEVDKTPVQEALAEIDVGRGRYEEAIVRYDRLARRERDPRFARRLEEIKIQWNAANMPPQFRAAAESEAITRADFAVLLYWKVSGVRFAQNLAAPQIAIDVAEVSGRDELIRAIALGVFTVDPVTRRVDPYRPVTAATFTRLVARVLTARGAVCARGVPYDPSELLRAQKILAACGINDPIFSVSAENAVSGRTATAVMEQVEKALGQ